MNRLVCIAANVSIILLVTSVIARADTLDTWYVQGNNDTKCILLRADIKIVLNGTSPSDTFPILNVTVTGICDKSEQSITLHFYSGWNLTMKFMENATKKYYMSEMVLVYGNDPANPTESRTFATAEVEVVDCTTDVGTRFQCTSRQPFGLQQTVGGEENSGVTFKELDISSLTLQAFHTGNLTDFSSSINRCKADEVSQLVPIIVGACLGGLIIIVLIAYLIGRRRSQRGYESV